jgi:hypothetical protein
MKLITVYISGKITGIPDRNQKAFRAAYSEIYNYFWGRRRQNKSNEKFVKYFNLRIINPIHIGKRLDRKFAALGKDEPEWADYMKVCVKKLCGADCLYFLKDWVDNEGASFEGYIAKRLNIPCADNFEELSKLLVEFVGGGK